jgi:hypothetical protein
MGQQQLLLIILGVIVVGIAVAVGITMFNDSATSANRDAVTNDLVNLASRAQQFYRRPVTLGGGGNTFTPSGTSMTLTKIAKTTGTSWSNGNGSYSLGTVTATQVLIVGQGTENAASGSPITVTMTVWADSAKVTGSN